MSDIDPKNILYSLATLCDSTPSVEPVARPKSCLSLHEDDWRQIEFVPQANRTYIEKELQSLSAFKEQNWSGAGWANVYVRREHPTALGAIGIRLPDVSSLSESPLWLGSGPPWGGLVNGGFALSDASGWSLYGQRMAAGKVLQLALSQSASEPSPALVEMVRRISIDFGLLLVDWYATSFVDTSSQQTLFAWSKRYQKS
jgi:hypothetical protein